MEYLMLPLVRSHCDVLKEILKETSIITCTGVIKCLNMDVEWSGYAQVYVQYYSSVVVEITFVWVYDISRTKYQWIIYSPIRLCIRTTQADIMGYDYWYNVCSTLCDGQD